MNSELIGRRISKLRDILNFNDEGILLTNDINIGYFSGFFHSEGYLLVTREKTVLFVDFRYYEAAQNHSYNCDVQCFANFFSDFSYTLKLYGIKNIFFEISDLTLAEYFRFKNHMEENSVECITSDLIDKKISEIRSIKDDKELEKILKAQQITEEAYLEVLNYLKPGVSERKIAIELEYLIKLKGGSGISFDLITITGSKTSLPHGVPSDNIVCEGDLFTFDIGSIYDGYHSDTTRTVAVRYADDEKRKVYDVVLRAQLEALKIIRPGIKCSDVDKTAREVIENEGYGKFFGHSTGHGVGLDIHEAPAVSSKSSIVLQEGMVITDEPGIYLPNKFGVRIEDMICITKDGYRNFVTLPKELIIV